MRKRYDIKFLNTKGSIPSLSLYRVFINDSKGAVGHGFQKSCFAEIMSHYDGSPGRPSVSVEVVDDLRRNDCVFNIYCDDGRFS